MSSDIDVGDRVRLNRSMRCVIPVDEWVVVSAIGINPEVVEIRTTVVTWVEVDSLRKEN